MPDEGPDIQSKNYLGDIKVVSRLLKGFSHEVLTFEDPEKIRDHVDQKAKALAKVFLGKNKNFPGPAWFSPGQIDVVVAERCGVDSTDPDERVAGALVEMVAELLHLANEQDPDWQAKSGSILKRYTYLFLGIPGHLSRD